MQPSISEFQKLNEISLVEFLAHHLHIEFDDPFRNHEVFGENVEKLDQEVFGVGVLSCFFFWLIGITYLFIDIFNNCFDQLNQVIQALLFRVESFIFYDSFHLLDHTGSIFKIHLFVINDQMLLSQAPKDILISIVNSQIKDFPRFQ